MSAAIFVGLIVISIGAVLFFRRRARADLVAGRRDLSFEELYQSSGSTAPLDTFQKVLNVLANGLGVSAGQLRTTDELRRLGEVDAWQAGYAQDQLEELTQGRTPPSSVRTIGDLIDWISLEVPQKRGEGS